MDKVNNLINTSYIFSEERQNMPFVYYSGWMDVQSIHALLIKVENTIASLKSSSDARKRIIGIITELLQNIYHHCPSVAFINTETTPNFLFQKRKEGFLITATNIIYGNEVAALEKRISTLNSCTDEELKSLYQETLKHGNLVGEHAGLGLIDIIRKSGNKILFKFVPVGNNYYLFTVKVPI